MTSKKGAEVMNKDNQNATSSVIALFGETERKFRGTKMVSPR